MYSQALDPSNQFRYRADDIRMASASPVRESPLQPDNWIQAAFSRLSAQGVEAVRIEIWLATLVRRKAAFTGISKTVTSCSSRVLLQWESEEMQWLEAAQESASGAAARWARFIERSANPERARLEVSCVPGRAQDEVVASRVAAIEAKRRAHIVSVLRDVGFTPSTAEKWSEIALLVYLGWMDRATRDHGFSAYRSRAR